MAVASVDNLTMPNHSSPHHRETLRKTPSLFFALVGFFVFLALIPTLWPELDLQAAALFTGDAPKIAVKHWWWVEMINRYVPFAFRVMVFTALVLWLVASLKVQWSHWRLPLAFIVLSGLLGPGLLVNAGFKDQWQRARPYQVENFGGTQKFSRAGVMTDQCTKNCSFVSGHVACGFFFASLMLLHRRRQVIWALVGTSAGLLIGFARMAAVAHWLSDVLWAAPITLMCSWVIWKILNRLYQPKPTLFI
jgi:lipid A 4'-phosphatase